MNTEISDRSRPTPEQIIDRDRYQVLQDAEMDKVRESLSQGPIDVDALESAASSALGVSERLIVEPYRNCIYDDHLDAYDDPETVNDIINNMPRNSTGAVRLVIDIETNGLLDVLPADRRVHCCCLASLGADGSELVQVIWNGLPVLLELIKREIPVNLYGHNITGFDIPFLNSAHPNPEFSKALNQESELLSLMDTLILSRVVNQVRSDGGQRHSHSLDSYAEELGFIKMKFPFELTGHYPLILGMQRALRQYCVSDVLNNYIVLQHLMYKVSDHISKGANVPDALRMETAVQQAVDAQDEFLLDESLILSVKSTVGLDLDTLQEEWDALSPTLPGPDRSPPNRQFKIDGTPTFAAFKFFKNLRKRGSKYSGTLPDGRVVDLPYNDPVKSEVPVPINSPTKVREYLKRRGVHFASGQKLGEVDKHWVYTEYLAMSTHPPSVRNIVRLHLTAMKLQHSASLLTGLKDSSTDGLLKAPAIAAGTRTMRYKHRVVANLSDGPLVPSKPYSAKSLMLPPDPLDQRMVGWDITGLESVMEAHWCYDIDPGYSNSILNGDVHTPNAERWGVTRNKAKEVKYALMYGVGIKKLAEILGRSESVAREIRDDFWGDAVALAKLKERKIREFESIGGVLTLDSRLVIPSGSHTVVNTLFQSSGAILAKRASLIMLQSTQHIRNGHAGPLIRYHDEEQWWASSGYEHSIGERGVASVKKAGEYYDLKVPITAEYKIGDSWADTH